MAATATYGMATGRFRVSLPLGRKEGENQTSAQRPGSFKKEPARVRQAQGSKWSHCFPKVLNHFQKVVVRWNSHLESRARRMRRGHTLLFNDSAVFLQPAW